MRKNIWKKGIVCEIILLLLITSVPFGQSISQTDSSKAKCNEMDQRTKQPILIDKVLGNQKLITSLKVTSEERTNQSWWNANWTYRKKITIDHTKVAGDLVNFPIFIITTMNNSKVQNDGDDIVFTDSQGIKLNHEIELYNYSTGELIVWVNITSVSPTEDKIFWMYYGNPICDNQQNIIGTWDSNYLLVDHMKDITPATTKDSTINRYNGTKLNVNEPVEYASGRIYRSQDFDGSNDRIDHTSPVIGTGVKTISMWYYSDVSENMAVFSNANPGGSSQNDGVDIWEAPGNRISIFLGDGGAPGVPGHFMSVVSTDIVTIGHWHYITFYYDGNALGIYVNSTLAGYTTTKGNPEVAGSQNLRFGSCHSGYCFNGKLDEIRVSNVARNLDWIATEFHNQNSPSTFMNIGDEEERSIPNANFTYTPLNPTNTTVILFNDTSTDINGTIVSWWWNFGDHYYSELQNPTHCYQFDGIYTVTLTVIDNYGSMNSIWKTIMVYTPPDNPPYEPANPVPPDAATDIPISINLMWTGGDPDINDTVSYDVYFGITNPPPILTANQSQTTYNLGSLNYFTAYYWRIIAWDNHNTSTQGPLWHFTTVHSEFPPYPPSNPSPPDNAINLPVNNITLSWTGGDPDPDDSATYDVYFNSTFPLTKLQSNISQTYCFVINLSFDTTYYWRVVAWDTHGMNTIGPVWTFQTEIEQNTPPDAPMINGPGSGKTGISYNYTFIAVDPEEDDIFYQINWGDGTNTSWLGPFESNYMITKNHTWPDEGTYTIEARAKDIYDAIGPWGMLAVTMPLDLLQKSGQSILQEISQLQLMRNNLSK